MGLTVNSTQLRTTQLLLCLGKICFSENIRDQEDMRIHTFDAFGRYPEKAHAFIYSSLYITIKQS